MKKYLCKFLLITSVLVVTGCAAGGSGVNIKINGVETVSSEPLESIKYAQKGQQLSFCVMKGVMVNDFQDRNSSVRDNNYYTRHLAEFIKNGTPFESIETIGDDAEMNECDILLYPVTTVYVTPMSNVEVNMTVTTKAVKVAGVDMSAYVMDEPSVEAAASRLGRVIYNAFVPGTQLYNQVAAQKASSAKDFEAVAAHYRSLSVKPTLPEEARKYMVQAEAAVKRQSFSEAADRYRDALKIAPWWPEGYFNRALLFGETGRYKEAIGNMKKYLVLVPAAADAQAAQDKIYEWEGLAAKTNGP